MNRDGFSIIEVLVGLIILTLGVLAMASASGYISMQVRLAHVRTQRSTAYESVTEELRSLNFDSVKDVTYANAEVVAPFKVWWGVNSVDWALKNVTLYTEGPGYVDGRLAQNARDTISVRIARRYP